MLATYVALGFVCYFTARRTGAGAWPSVAAVIPGMILMTAFVAERAQIFSYVFFAVAILAVRTALRGSNKALIGLALLFVVWSNMHLAFVAGVAVCALIALGDALRNKRVARPAVVVAVITAAGMINPYHIRAYTAGFHVRTASPMVMEWRHASIHQRRDVALFTLCAIAFIALWRSGRWRNLAVVLPILAFTALTLDAVRNTPFLVILIIPELAVGCSSIRLAPHRARALLHGTIIGFVVLAIITLTGFSLRPVDNNIFAVRSIEAIPAGCRLLNEYGQGGYIIDQRWPEVRVSQDGRNDLYGAAKVTEQDDVLRATHGWRAWLDRNDVRCVLARPTRPIVHKLEATGWRRAASDPSAVLLVRS
jgi:hypothetical protein